MLLPRVDDADASTKPGTTMQWKCSQNQSSAQQPWAGFAQAKRIRAVWAGEARQVPGLCPLAQAGLTRQEPHCHCFALPQLLCSVSRGEADCVLLGSPAGRLCLGPGQRAALPTCTSQLLSSPAVCFLSSTPLPSTVCCFPASALVSRAWHARSSTFPCSLPSSSASRHSLCLATLPELHFCASWPGACRFTLI